MPLALHLMQNDTGTDGKCTKLQAYCMRQTMAGFVLPNLVKLPVAGYLYLRRKTLYCLRVMPLMPYRHVNFIILAELVGASTPMYAYFPFSLYGVPCWHSSVA